MLERSINWLAFCTTSQLTKALVHVFPVAIGDRVPYKVAFTITVLKNNGEPLSVVADGARLGQPNGFSIEQIFPDLPDTKDYLPLLIELTSPQPHLNITPSDCVIEFSSQFSTVKFRPSRLSLSDGIYPLAVAGDGDVSLISINPMTEAYSASVVKLVNSSGNVHDVSLLDFEVAPTSVHEQSLSELLVSQSGEGLYIKSSQLMHYLVYKKAQKIVSIVGV